MESSQGVWRHSQLTLWAPERVHPRCAVTIQRTAVTVRITRIRFLAPDLHPAACRTWWRRRWRPAATLPPPDEHLLRLAPALLRSRAASHHHPRATAGLDARRGCECRSPGADERTRRLAGG